MRQNHKNTLFLLYMIATNRPCGAVGVEDINGLVRNTKGLVVRNAKWFAIRRDKGLVMPMVVSTNESN